MAYCYSLLIAFPLWAATHQSNVELTAKKSFQSQILCSNTCYIIKDGFDLGGSVVAVPGKCVLKFEGGYLTNGTIVGNETLVDASAVPVFSNTLHLKGEYLAPEAYPEWFDYSDDAEKIRMAVIHFDNVKLIAKHYILQSVNSRGYAIELPSGHILSGNRIANNTVSSDQILELQHGVKYNAVISLNSGSCISNLTIKGDNFANSSCVATTEGFQSRLSIERVSVSGSFYGFNLQTYLSNLSQCTANYNSIGFYIHGKYSGDIISVEGTSINMSTCYAVDSKKAGFDLSGITYTTMNNCAADGCGAPTSGLLTNKTDIGYSYSFTQCKNITVNSCGAESCLGAVMARNCKNIIFNAPSFLINIRKEVHPQKDYKLKPVINLRYSAYIEFNYPFVNTSGVSEYYNNGTQLMLLYGSSTSVPSAIINHGYEGIPESNIGTEGFLKKSTNLIYK